MGVPRPVIALLVGLAVTAAVGCTKDTPTAGPTPAGTAQASPEQTPPPSVSTAGAGDFCTLAIKIATDSGMMVNKHYVPQQQETLDMFKAVVIASLAAQSQMEAGLPPDVLADVKIVMQYFQALKDSDFSNSTPVPAGFVEANKRVNQYQVDVCGVTFDQ
jgi:hypothetical protein